MALAQAARAFRVVSLRRQPQRQRPSNLACCRGRLLHGPQISKVYTHYAATILFFFFGFKTLYDTYLGGHDVSGSGA